jgi:endo-1,4-beta-xylanase
MSTSRGALLRACLLLSISGAALAQTQPVVVEAESGTLGASLAVASTGAVTYITTTENSAANPTPARTAVYQVTFPAAGNYELYARILIGPTPGGNDDSFYVGNGFNTTTNWSGAYNTSTGGFTGANQTVVPDGAAGQNVYKWVKLSGGGVGPNTWVVPSGALTQSFAWGSREDGLNFDKFAFGVQGVCYTVANLDGVQNASGICPPPPPPDPEAYTRTLPPLAGGKDKYLGSAWSPGTASLNFVNYWNQVTPENGGKWGSVEGTRDVMNWAQADESYALAKANRFPFKWHTLIWGNQQPAWIESLSTAEQREEIEEWYAAVAARYPDIDQIEVVNEALHDPPRGATNGNYIEALGGNGVTGWDWVITSFQLARQYFPNAELILNDYSISNDGNATTNYINLINLLKERGLIDAIGDQAHAFSTTEAAPMTNHRNNLNRLAATGLPIYITELDVDGVLQGVVHNETQLASFKRIFPVFWEHPAVKGVTIWGYVRGFHWRNATGAWLLYPNGGERPALTWLAEYVANNQPRVNGGQSFTVSETLAAGAAIGTVQATDPDAGTTLSQWQIEDRTNTFAVDASTGTLRLRPGASLDFDYKSRYTVYLSVWDGYTRSKTHEVDIDLTNENDNAPTVTEGQAFDIDGVGGVVGAVEVSDDDDNNDLGFTTFQSFTIVGGDAGNVFRIDPASGLISVAKPGSIDWSGSQYVLAVTVGDGTHMSTPTELAVYLPRTVDLCVRGVAKSVPREQAGSWIAQGASLGGCAAQL